MKKILFTAAVPVLIAAVLFTCGQKESNAEATSESIDESAVAVQLTEVKEGNYTLPAVASGLVTTSTESRLSFKIGGIVSRILVEEGQTVTRGQLLATLDPTEIDAQLSQAKNNLDKFARDFERVERLYKDSAATLEQFQNVKTGYDVANESYRIASFNKQYATIRANASGKVIRKFVNEGELVNGGSPVLMINSAAENNWIVRVGLADVDWVRVKKGDKAVVKMDAYANEPFDGIVSLLAEAADPVSGLYLAEVKVNPQGKKLASGLVATVQVIPSEARQLKSIPIESIVEGAGSHAFVFVPNTDQKSVRKVSVQVAWIADSQAIVANGLEDVSVVVSSGSAFLTESSTIRVTPSTQN